MKYLITIYFFAFSALCLYSQSPPGKKQGIAVKIDNPPVINGILDDRCWTNSGAFTDFIQYEPYSGLPSRQRTVARVVYDNEGIYIGAMLYDLNPDSIRTEMGPRDGDMEIIADYFNVDIGPYNDGINGYSFKLTASGIQSDIRRSSGTGGRDLDWDAVWHSAARIVDSGWIAEIRIPFSAFRFSGENNEAWGFNLWRYIQRYGEWSSWNFADKSHGTSINYLGEITGINSIKSPPRISVTPYISAYIEKQAGEEEWNNAFHGGADLKVGLNDAFTLDATLIPDFGQVQSDDQILNLTPYEVKYNERRQFFTEGTDVFNKGGIFYSRRIGSTPTGYYSVDNELEPGEEVEFNPAEVRLINATKISGRTTKGLGIGFFNGITAESRAEIINTENNNTREIVTQPLTNYNMIVVDQNLGAGSYMSLANTNVLRSRPATGNNYTANVTATDMRYLSHDRTYSVNAVIALSQKYFSDSDNIFGHSIILTGGKTGGKFRYYYTHRAITNDYDPNDMGYLRRNNEFNNSLTFGYNIYEPVGKILHSLNRISMGYDMLHTPRKFSSLDIDFESTTTYRNFMVLQLESNINPIGTDDHYEAREEGRYYSRPPSATITASLATDNRRAISVMVSAEYQKFFSEYNMSSYRVSLSPSIRFNNKFKLGHTTTYHKKSNDIGYAGQTGSIIFGRRNSGTVENILSINYIISASSYCQARIRHYWSKADYVSYYVLNEDGSLGEDAPDMGSDINTNYFNIDMSYTWRFAPGSELKFVWKNSVYQSGPEIFASFRENLDALLDAPAINSLSLKILYYLDYHTLRSRL
ncbi:MAG: carbohydrate binding family 9 domain-containing protein [Bacteroidales bacterium]|nr:carbohydrate binding family 9 domain-containing protein [Bacteroidales bacterium]